MEYILQTKHLTKTIGGKDLVTDVNLHVKKGEIYGFLGPNGAGKTTVMKMLTNLWKPTAGSVELFGEPLLPGSYGVLKRMGSVIEFPTFYEHLSGRENLELHCEYLGYYNPGSVEKALEMLGLVQAEGQQVKRYSLGMKQRLGIARVVLTKPELLILDEPANGLDPAGMKQMRELFRMLCSEYEITLMVSSHLLSEIEAIADTVGVIAGGKLLQETSMEEIAQENAAFIELKVNDVRRAAYVLADQLNLRNFKVFDMDELRVYDGSVTAQELSKAMVLNGVEVRSVHQSTESLEDYFLKMTREERRWRTCGN